MSILTDAADSIDHLADALPDHLPAPWRADGPSGGVLCAADGTVLPPDLARPLRREPDVTPDQIRAVVYRSTGRDLADAAWDRTLAALDGDGGVSIARRAAIAEDTVELWPIESDALDARDEARRAAEDEARERWDLW